MPYLDKDGMNYAISKIKSLIPTVYDWAKSSTKPTYTRQELVPISSKTYESTTYYGTANNDAGCTFYFLSVKPDSWYKPWTVKFKVRTTIPSKGANYDSVTVSTISGRTDLITYHNWNERYDAAHYYINIYRLNKTGFDAGYSHAIGVNIYNTAGATSSAYYRTFEVEYYECDNCTVAVLDAPLKQSAWNGYGSTNFSGTTNANAVDRGLQETGDVNSGDYNQRDLYFRPYVATKLFGYKIFAIDKDMHVQPLVITDGNATGKQTNTNGFRGSLGLFYNGTSSSANVAYAMPNQTAYRSYAISSTYTGYTFNSALGAEKMVYITGTYDVSTDIFTLPSSTGTDWYIEIPSDQPTITLSDYLTENSWYMFVGATHSTANNLSLFDQNPIFYFNGTSLIPVGNLLNSHTHSKSEITDFPTFKTINGNSIVGSGNITISSGSAAKKFTNVSVASSLWVANTDTDQDFLYMADIPCTGVTADDYPEVVLADDDIDEYGFSIYAKSGSGNVRVYTDNKPSTALTVPTIICI